MEIKARSERILKSHSQRWKRKKGKLEEGEGGGEKNRTFFTSLILRSLNEQVRVDNSNSTINAHLSFPHVKPCDSFVKSIQDSDSAGVADKCHCE